jgi:hypothetical protein
MLDSAVLCRPSSGVCDVSETCDGEQPECPSDEYVPSGVACRTPVCQTDPTEVCDGLSVACPADVPAPACAAVDIGGIVPQSVFGHVTSGACSSHVPSCGGEVAGGGGEIAYRFTPPGAGQYVFDTYGSDYIAVLTALAGTDCHGEELSCDVSLTATDAMNVYSTSRAVLDLDSEQPVTLVVDGFECDEGAVVLNVAACQAEALPSSVPQFVLGSTIGRPNALLASCSPSLAGDVLYSFTAPEAGTYTFSTVLASTTYDTALLILATPDCAAPELACNDDAAFPTELRSTVSVALESGQTVGIAVDGYGGSEGAYQLSITRED